MTRPRSPEKEMAELLAREPQDEFSFYFEGAADQLRSGITLATLRRDDRKYQTTLPGDIIIADCPHDRAKVPLMVIAIKYGHVDKFPLPLLGLDGFMSHEQAVERLAHFYPGFNEKTPARLLTFLTVENFRRLSAKKQTYLFGLQYYEEAEVMSNPLLREIFFPSLAFWFAFRGGTGDDWFSYLANSRLAKISALQKAGRELNKFLDAEYHEYPKLLSCPKIWTDNQSFTRAVDVKKLTDPLYSWLVLLRKPLLFDPNQPH